MQRSRILFVVNEAGFFLSHRLPVARAAQAAGYDVHVATPEGKGVEKIKACGLTFHAVPLSRRGTLILDEIGSLVSLFRLYRLLRPHLVHHVTIKPVLYGGIMARLARVPAAVNAVTGLGYLFAARGFKVSLLRKVVMWLYGVALRHPNARAIFQNPDDRDMFVKSGILNTSRAVVIKGSGVDMNQFVPNQQIDNGVPMVVFASRMLWHKGVGEFVEAARRLRNKATSARFVLVGDTDSGNPTAVSTETLQNWHREGAVEWWGRQEDMPQVLSRSVVVCLPSAYGEGVPKILIEAAACGRAIVTTDAPGCREVVKHGENGLLVPVGDVVALASALEFLINDPVTCRRMGRRGREIAEAEFGIERVVGETLRLYRELLA